MDVIVQGLARGGIFVLVAAGFAMLFGTGRVLNLAHGTYFMLGAHATWLLRGVFASSMSSGMATACAVLGAAVAMAALGAGMHVGLLARLASSPTRLMVTSLAINAVAASALQVVVGGRALMVPPIVSGSVVVGGTPVLRQSLLAVPVALVVVVVMGALLHGTRMGRDMRALADDAESAALAGIESGPMLTGLSAVAAGLAGLAGGLVSPVQVISPLMWIPALTVAFAVACVGGRGRMTGFISVALALGLVEAVVIRAWGDAASGLASLAVVVIVLALRPRGLLDGTS